MSETVEVLQAPASQPGRLLLEVLLAAEASLDEGELVAAVGDGAGEAADEMQRRGMVARESGRLRLAMPARDYRLATSGIASERAWAVLGRVAERTQAGWPLDPDVLLLRCRILTRSAKVAEALELLAHFRGARHAVALARLAAIVRTMAAADPSCARRSFLLLAREQLRRGEVERACLTIDEAEAAPGTGGCADELRVLRAEAHARGAHPGIAAEVFRSSTLPSGMDSSAGQLLLAELTIQRGNLAGARRALRSLAQGVVGRPQLLTRWWIDLALTYVCESRFELARGALRRARRACGPRPGPLEPSLKALEVLVRIHLDQLDAAAAMLAAGGRVDAPHDDPTASLLRAALSGRQGDMQGCLSVGLEGAALLAQRGDRFLLTVLQRYLGHAAMGLGLLDRAEQLFRSVVGVEQESDLGVLSSHCERDFALLAEARGDLQEARHRAQRALSSSPRDPYARIEAWVLAGAEAPCTDGMPAAVAAYAQLRRAEHCVRRGELDEASCASRVAAQWYREAGAHYEFARALAVQAEALVRLGRAEDAASALELCEQTARNHGLQPLIVTCSLLRASIADRCGDLDAYAQALASASRHAAAHVPGSGEGAACHRLGISDRYSPAGPAPFAQLVARLGLARPATWVVTCGDRTWLTEKRGRQEAELELDAELLAVRAGRQRWDLSGQPLLFRLLDALVCAGAEGVSVETLYERIWGGQYHPLRHRNTVYGAITRLRRGLDPLVPDRPWLVQDEGRYCLRSVSVAVIVAAGSCDAPRARCSRMALLDETNLPGPAEYAHRFGMSLGHARWELALIKADTAPCSCPAIPAHCLLRKRPSASWNGDGG